MFSHCSGRFNKLSSRPTWPWCVVPPDHTAMFILAASVFSSHTIVVVLEKPETHLAIHDSSAALLLDNFKNWNEIIPLWYLSLPWYLLRKQPMSQSDQWHIMPVRSWWACNLRASYYEFMPKWGCLGRAWDLSFFMGNIYKFKKKTKKNILQHDSYKSLLYHLVWYKDFESLTM